ncbi:hypothetical protein AVEN_45148-1 [Araneus ventricosus]|uniref:Uncharacterized protein n=1 Tax=Araneus ventricosus TaxID=182803 RepID=A0A4Y2GV77_ARAVE|nr:hypothetical protein AVEN_45148-1 [Araneus ventricosus]
MTGKNTDHSGHRYCIPLRGDCFCSDAMRICREPVERFALLERVLGSIVVGILACPAGDRGTFPRCGDLYSIRCYSHLSRSSGTFSIAVSCPP